MSAVGAVGELALSAISRRSAMAGSGRPDAGSRGGSLNCVSAGTLPEPRRGADDHRRDPLATHRPSRPCCTRLTLDHYAKQGEVVDPPADRARSLTAHRQTKTARVPRCARRGSRGSAGVVPGGTAGAVARVEPLGGWRRPECSVGLVGRLRVYAEPISLP